MIEDNTLTYYKPEKIINRKLWFLGKIFKHFIEMDDELLDFNLVSLYILEVTAMDKRTHPGESVYRYNLNGLGSEKGLLNRQRGPIF